MRWDQPDAAFDWALDFNEAAIETDVERPRLCCRSATTQHFRLAAPTPDHFIPLLYIAGLAHAADSTAEVLIDGYAMGSLSMTSFTVV